jgi:alkyl hydroperoxide reductase subunit AhpF
LGPAGVAAAVYAGSNKIKTLVIGEEIGGQSVEYAIIQTLIGIPSFLELKWEFDYQIFFELLKKM